MVKEKGSALAKGLFDELECKAKNVRQYTWQVWPLEECDGRKPWAKGSQRDSGCKVQNAGLFEVSCEY